MVQNDNERRKKKYYRRQRSKNVFLYLLIFNRNINQIIKKKLIFCKLYNKNRLYAASSTICDEIRFLPPTVLVVPKKKSNFFLLVLSSIFFLSYF